MSGLLQIAYSFLSKVIGLTCYRWRGTLAAVRTYQPARYEND